MTVVFVLYSSIRFCDTFVYSFDGIQLSVYFRSLYVVVFPLLDPPTCGYQMQTCKRANTNQMLEVFTGAATVDMKLRYSC